MPPPFSFPPSDGLWRGEREREGLSSVPEEITSQRKQVTFFFFFFFFCFIYVQNLFTLCTYLTYLQYVHIYICTASPHF